MSILTLVRPRLNDFYNLPFSQEQVPFAIPFLSEDIPLYVDPFLLWKSPSLQDQALHTALLSAFNHFGFIAKRGKETEARSALVQISECEEVGLGTALNKRGNRIGEKKAAEILDLFANIPQIEVNGLHHIEELQLLVEQISKDRISDITCSLLKSFLIDFTIDQAESLNIPLSQVELQNVFDLQRKRFNHEQVSLPVNPITKQPILLVPKRWLRFIPWINYEDYFANGFVPDSQNQTYDRVKVMNFNRHNYDMVQVYLAQKERTQVDCKNDPLFKPIPIVFTKRKLSQITKLPSGKTDNADRKYEDSVSQLMASLLYPHLDFACEQSRTDSGVLIRDLIFYNNRSIDFLKDIYNDFGSRQIVMELKNVHEVTREHINQLNRYLNQQFGRFGIIVTRNPLPRRVFKNTVDLWAGQRKCIIAITDKDLETMVNVFETKQRLPIEVIKRAYVDFVRACPS